MVWSAILGAGIGALGTAAAIQNEREARDEAERNSYKALKEIEKLDRTPYDLERLYQYYQDPEAYQALTLGNSAYEDISVDPSVLSAQNRALEELINLSEANGLNAIDQQALQEIVNEENRNLQGQNDAIMQDAMQRGVYGSGLEMAQRLQAAQSAANRMNSRDMDVMSQAQQRALEALSAYGNLAGNMRTQGFNEQDKIANAKDIIARSNWENAQNVLNNNVTDRNKTRAANTDIANSQQDANFEASTTRMGNDKDITAMKTNQYNNNTTVANQMADRRNKTIGTLTTALGSAVNSYNDDSEDKKKVG